MGTQLPVTIDSTYPDRSPGDKLHQEHHDRIHAETHNPLEAIADGQLVAKAAGAVAARDPADFQPSDVDLTAIAALSTSAFGRSLLEKVDAAAARTDLDVYSKAAADAAYVAKSVVDLRGKDIHAELLALYDAGGGKAVVPMGTIIEVDDTITVGGRVRLTGDGYGGVMSVIKASATFPTDGRPLIRLDRAADAAGHAPGNLLSGLVINCNDRAQVGVYSENVQEGGGVTDCQVIKWTRKAIHFSGAKCMHFSLRDLWGYSSESADPTGIGLHLDGCASTNPVERVTFAGSNAANIAAGMHVAGSKVTLIDGHFETATDGVLCTGNAIVRILGATGHATLPTVVRVQGTAEVKWWDVIPDGSTNAIMDETSGSPVVRTARSGIIRGEQYIKGAASSRSALQVQGAATVADIVAFATSDAVNRFRVNSAGQVVIGGDTAVNPQIQINGAAGTVRRMSWLSGGLTRWLTQLSNTAESGGDVGSDLEFLTRTDAGGAKATVGLWERATGIFRIAAVRIGVLAADPVIRSGTGTPEGAVTADPGSLYLNKSGGAGATFWAKESGTGNTGWVAK